MSPLVHHASAKGLKFSDVFLLRQSIFNCVVESVSNSVLYSGLLRPKRDVQICQRVSSARPAHQRVGPPVYVAIRFRELEMPCSIFGFLSLLHCGPAKLLFIGRQWKGNIEGEICRTSYQKTSTNGQEPKKEKHPKHTWQACIF